MVVALIAALVGGITLGVPIGANVAGPPRPLTTEQPATWVKGSFDAATRHDDEFNRTFEHRFETVGAVKMHFVTGGEGPALVLLHGWPQTWFEWRGIMPDLAREHTVYAVDLPGLGDSVGSPASFAKSDLADDVAALMERLGVDRYDLVAHDLGAGVGFQLASRHPDAVRRYVHMDYPLPSTAALPAQRYRSFSWHMAFNSQSDIPNDLVDSDADVREYLVAFYPQVAYGGSAFGGHRARSPFTAAQVDEFARTYARPGVMDHGYQLYRSLDQDQRDNDAAAPVTSPTVLLTATGSLASTLPTVAPLFTDLRDSAEIPESGHWLPDENPKAVTAAILEFVSNA